MRLKAITQFLKDLGSGLKHFFTSRIVPFVLVVIVLFGILLSDCKGRILQTELYNESPERDCNCGTKRQYLR